MMVKRVRIIVFLSSLLILLGIVFSTLLVKPLSKASAESAIEFPEFSETWGYQVHGSAVESCNKPIAFDEYFYFSGFYISDFQNLDSLSLLTFYDEYGDRKVEVVFDYNNSKVYVINLFNYKMKELPSIVSVEYTDSLNIGIYLDKSIFKSEDYLGQAYFDDYVYNYKTLGSAFYPIRNSGIASSVSIYDGYIGFTYTYFGIVGLTRFPRCRTSCDNLTFLLQENDHIRTRIDNPTSGSYFWDDIPHEKILYDYTKGVELDRWYYVESKTSSSSLFESGLKFSIANNLKTLNFHLTINNDACVLLHNPIHYIDTNQTIGFDQYLASNIHYNSSGDIVGVSFRLDSSIVNEYIDTTGLVTDNKIKFATEESASGFSFYEGIAEDINFSVIEFIDEGETVPPEIETPDEGETIPPGTVTPENPDNSGDITVTPDISEDIDDKMPSDIADNAKVGFYTSIAILVSVVIGIIYFYKRRNLK